jgi:hypothetical protein
MPLASWPQRDHSPRMKTIGRTVAALFATHAILAPLANFKLPWDQAALALFVVGLTWVVIGIAMQPVLRPRSEAAALAFFGITVTILCGLLVEGVAMQAQMPALRRPAHLMNLLLGGVAFLVFYGALFRFALIPRILSAFALVTAAILIVGALIPLLGNPTVMLFFMPVGLSQLAVIVWLAIKGFDAGQGARTT